MEGKGGETWLSRLDLPWLHSVKIGGRPVLGRHRNGRTGMNISSQSRSALRTSGVICRAFPVLGFVFRLKMKVKKKSTH